ncbi:MAG: MaoC family dehydratase N-terminal domain-containing protein [Proteobacteria bacterium]|uniref:FAS1-like dehydratase domain-containing protein n=1 Tax=Piscinibacter sp. TaxID=1903157 RepID=UPI001B644061|nr:MaoC family dehydratase N-terminal domain-containing protein [Piscinibacter sp.]MBP5991834.1 MaoC family dehydratase N-terminal domain-containing protein [Piscinibacter sp.]MBP6029199.1 MaoC family dehydratase N-terminal domain-containing protein [Piscinibacter sp.]MBS0440996.1 MaoC family dehydratase N-terminal domain-containing protein [Pseudomonadota bacterium]
MEQQLTDWIGRSETLRDQITAAPVRGLNATLDHPAIAVENGTPLFPLWHWLYFLPQHRQSEIGPDGHAKRGGFLPPVPLPRRMWAGSQFEFRAPVRVGDAVERSSTIADVTTKEGRSGKLVFVKVRHELRCNGAADPAIVEFHDIVYRDAKKPGDVEPPPTPAAQGDWQREIVPDDVLLFRYSALTFNGHRIHYDRQYVTQVEGYPGLIVHGPLIATLLMDLVRRHAPDAQVASFRFKAVRPTFDLHPFKLNGRREGNEVKLWAQDHEGWLTMDAVATLKG